MMSPIFGWRASTAAHAASGTSIDCTGEAVSAVADNPAGHDSSGVEDDEEMEVDEESRLGGAAAQRASVNADGAAGAIDESQVCESMAECGSGVGILQSALGGAQRQGGSNGRVAI